MLLNKNKVPIDRRLPLVAAIVILLVSCADPGLDLPSVSQGDESGDFAVVSNVANADYLVVALDSGRVTSIADPGDLSNGYRADTMLFRKLGERYLGVFEVTQRQWLAIGGSDTWSQTTGTVVASVAVADDMPAFGASHEAITAALQQWNRDTEVALVLPSEALWQQAAGSAAYVWGDDIAAAGQHAQTWLTRGVQVASPAPVGSLPATGLGFYDMAGNVWEWTAAGTALKGGSWHDGVDNTAPQTALAAEPNQGHVLFGMRLELRL